MIDRIGQNSASGVPADPSQGGETRRVLRMVKSERMGGSVPVWETVSTPQQTVESALSLAQSGRDASTANALAYNPTNVTANTPEEFGFGDLLDMVNPLQHIPVVGHFYRRITGDEIKPIGQIIGGAVFGGAIGAAGGLINAVVINETGKDIADNAISLAFKGESLSMKTAEISDHPEQRLNEAVKAADLPGELLAFADLGTAGITTKKRDDSIQHETIIWNQPARNYPQINNLGPREPITQTSISPYNIY